MSATERTLRDLLQANRPGGEPKTTRRRKAAVSRTAAPSVGEVDDARRGLIRALLERMGPVYVTDADGNLVAYSRAFADLSAALFGVGAAGGAAGALATPPGLMEILEQLYGEKRELRRSDTVEADDETRYLVSRHFPIHDESGELIGFGGIYDDVTPAARASHRASEMEGWLQDVIRSSSDWVWAVDANVNITFVSPRISEILEEPPQLIVGRHLFSLGEFDTDDPPSAKTRASIARRAPFRARRFFITDKQGKRRHVLLSGVPVFDDSGRFVGYRGTGTDVTSRIEAERMVARISGRLEETVAELQKRNEELAIALEHSRVADQAKMDFLAMMSHELKTPLNCVIGFSEAATQHIHGPLSTAYEEYFQNIHKAGRHLLAIINDLLDTANLERQDLPVKLERQRVDRLVSEAVALVDLGAASRSLDLSALRPESDLVVMADHLRARQIIVNLVSNAIKFTPDRGRIGIDMARRPDGKVGITVWDTGIGIPAEEQARVFDKFYQVEHNILSRGTEGTGLGLSISRHLARLMGGDLTLVSVPGEGSRFTLVLPAAVAEPAKK